jgi:hypothetical protein
MTPDPFAVLGLPATPLLTDEDIRAAWRAIATATHPDREDGGNPAAYRAASAAFTTLRSPWGRTEAYADLAHGLPEPAASPPPVPVTLTGREPAAPFLPLPGITGITVLPGRVRHGRPARLTIRILAAAVTGAAAWLSGAGVPAIAGVLAAVVTWLLLTARGDLAPPPGR